VLGLVAVVAAAALILGTTGGVVVRRQSDGGSSRFVWPDAERMPTDDTRPDGSFGDFGASAPTDIDVESIAERVSPAVVNLAVTLASGYRTAGSGLVITRTGHVLTNNHVINGASRIDVEIGGDNEFHDAEVLGYDMGDDVALLKIEDVSGLETIRAAPPGSVSRSDSVVAIGNARGRFGEPSAVAGTVAALGESITAGDGPERETLPNMIRFSGSIQPGDSGGALVDARGRVIGMNTAADPGGEGRFGFSAGTTGFAIPIGTALGIADQIRAGDERNGVHVGDRALLGVELSSASEEGRRPGDSGHGARVAGIGDDSPAADAGIEEGSAIVGVGRSLIRDNDDLREALNRFHPGDRVVVRWIDDSGEAHRATVTLTKGPPA
jgi:S1-C subfamily serine protease